MGGQVECIKWPMLRARLVLVVATHRFAAVALKDTHKKGQLRLAA